jgi:murein DD-endopeptidase MepM/ murein hydrolase activator NlpD
VNPRRWTILVVPHDSDAPRQYEIGERGIRFFAGAAGAIALLIFASFILLFSGWATPGARLAARENERLSADLARAEGALAQLGDSLGVLSERESLFREIAGIPANTQSMSGSAPAAAATTSATNRASMDRAKPFAQYFGNREDRPDPVSLLRRAGELSTSFAMASDSMAARVERAKAVPNIMPTKGWLTSAFSRARLHPILNKTRPHEGIDVSAPAGSAIVAPAAGVVTKTGYEGGYGNVVTIDHGNGIETLYAHCSRILVRPGARVERGQLIAKVGSTGLAVGPHLHYEVIVNGKNVDPKKYVMPGAAVSEKAHD